MYGAIRGMLDTLDPHTVFMPPDVFKEMKIDTSGEFGGLGIEIARKNDNIVVVAPIDDTPAQRAGIKSLRAMKKFSITGGTEEWRPPVFEFAQGEGI